MSRKTRADRAGPNLTTIGSEKQHKDEHEAGVRRWLYTWVRPLVLDLVPELSPAARHRRESGRRT